MPVKVLICDEDTDLLSLYKLILPRPEFEVKTIRSSAQLYNTAKEFQPDKIILDVYFDGWVDDGLISQLKSDPDFNLMSIILCSTSVQTDRIAEKYELEHYFTKPFEMRDIVGLMRATTTAPAA